MVFSKFVSPRNDVAFRRLFGQVRNQDILIHFLNDVLDLGKAKVQSVEFLRTIQDSEAMSKKESIVDVLCKDQFGDQHIIELQLTRTENFAKGAQFYAERAYGSQPHQNQTYASVKQVIFLAITSFTIFPDKEEYKFDHVIFEKNLHENDLKNFSFTILELPKFQKSIRECNTMLEKWTYFLKHAEETPEYDVKPFAGNDAILERAYQELNKTYWSEAEMNSYESDEKRVRDNQSALDYARDVGFAEGLEIGRAKARVMIAIALRMLSKGMSITDISEFTGLSVHDIEKLRKNNP
jgi:predicted transposase/invertase (TIGR01784 family)